MLRPDFEAIAAKIVRQCARVKPDEHVMVSFRSDALHLAESVALQCYQIGAVPWLVAQSDNLRYRLLTEVPADHLRKRPCHAEAMVRAASVAITLGAMRADPARFRDVSPDQWRAYREGTKLYRDLLFASDHVRWLAMDYPTPQQAASYEIEWEAYHDAFWGAVAMDYSDLKARAFRVARVLAESDGQVHITSATGTDLRFSVAGRRIHQRNGTFFGSATVMSLPAGEVSVAPIETSAQGRAVFDLDFYSGHRIEGLVVDFDEGLGRPIAAREGLEVVREALAQATGDKDRIGELGIGLNEAITRITGNTLLDEKILGTVHIALGDNRTFGGTNNASIHWDLVIQSPTVTVGETVLMDEGRLLA